MLLALLLRAHAADYADIAATLDTQLFRAWKPSPTSRAAVVVMPPDRDLASAPSSQVVAFADALAVRMRAQRRFDAITSPSLTGSLLAVCRLTGGDLRSLPDLRTTWSRRARVDVLVWVTETVTRLEPSVEVTISAATTAEPTSFATAASPL